MKNNLLTKYKYTFSLAVLFNTLSALLSLVFAIMLGQIIQSAIQLDKKLYNNIMIGILILITIFITKNIASFFKRRYVLKSTIYYKNLLSNKILKLDFENFFKNNNSFYTNILVNEANMLSSQYFESYVHIIDNSIQLTISIIGLFVISYKLGLVMVIFIVIYLLIPNFFGKLLNKYNNQLTIQNEKILSFLKSMFQGFEIIKTFNIIDRSINQYKDYNNLRELTNTKYKKLNDIKNITIELLAFILLLAMISIGALLLYQNLITVTLLFASIQLINNTINPISYLFMYLSEYNSTKSIRDKHLSMLNENQESIKHKNEIKDNKIEINIKNLSFAYEDKKVISNFNYHFKTGKKYVLIGSSGTGKSTLIKLIGGYFSNYTGDICYNDLELREIDKNSLYNNITIIHQNVFIFEDTLENNIKLGKNISDEEYKNIIEKTNLVMLEKKLNDEILYDNGDILSGGEKQRIAIARSLVQKSNILLIDEATSSLDPQNEKIVNDIILNLEGVICIVITHNQEKEFLNKFDDIIELKNINL